jgi:hypothetical protein
MTSSLLEAIDDAERGHTIISNLKLPPRLNYYLVKYGLKQHDFGPRDIRPYIIKLIQTDYEAWSAKNKKDIYVDDITHKILERESGR